MLRARLGKYVWPAVGLAAVTFSGWLLYKELRSLSLGDLLDSFAAIGLHQWVLAVGATLCAYGALAWYDRIGLLYLGKSVSWVYISIASFTAYALSHNIGASVLSGAVIRYRAYSKRHLTTGQVAVLVAFCSFTFGLGTVMLGGLVLIVEPDIADHFIDVPEWVASLAGFLMLGLVAAYVAVTRMNFAPLKLGQIVVHRPPGNIVVRQLLAAPIELVSAAAIIYFALPAEGNPGYLVILGVFLASFSAALLSHAPGGLGVLEVLFVTALPEIDPADVLAALIVFRLLYLIIPLALSLIVVLVYEHSQFSRSEDDARRPVETPPNAPVP